MDVIDRRPVVAEPPTPDQAAAPAPGGAEMLIRCLRAEGVEAIFAIADISYGPVLQAARRAGMRIVGGRHESAEVHMADAWARVTGTMAVAMAGMGPGVANLVPAVTTAWIEGVPVMVIATQRVRRANRAVRRGRFQFTPQLDLFRPITKYAAAVPDASRIGEHVREAFRHALSGRPGPVYLEFEADVLRDAVDEPHAGVLAPRQYRAMPGAPSPTDVERAADLLTGSTFPLVFAGNGIHRSGASAELQAVAEHLGALVMTTPGARGAIPESHPLAIGMGFPPNSPAHLGADVILAVGTQLGETNQYLQPPSWAGPTRQRLVHLDADAMNIGVNRSVDVALVGDAREGLEALLVALRRRAPARQPNDEARAYAQQYHEISAAFADAYAGIDVHPVHPGRVAAEVTRFFGPDAIACIDGGNTQLWAHLTQRIERPRSLLASSHLGHLGTGLPYAIGAKLAAPDRPVYLLCGDGAFGFNLQELETAAREKANIVVVVSCDFAWAMEETYMAMEVQPTIGVHTSPVRYDEVARGMGCHGEYVERGEDLESALQRAQAAGRPAVIQVIVDFRENVEPPVMRDFLDMYAALDT